jgi:two-component system, LytTR family, sensor histidine kinase AlgZ
MSGWNSRAVNSTEILSSFQTSPPPPVRRELLVFDACHVGVVLRAVLFVEAVVATAALYGTATPVAWLERMALITGAALPATLVWLLGACGLKRPLSRLPRPGQFLAGGGLGAVAGLYGCGLIAMVGWIGPPPWLASAWSGALLGGVAVAALVWRARAAAPADTAARLADLQNRIRPHFLFNTLNSAIALVRAEPARAEALLEDLSELFRHALAERGTAVSLADELSLATRYLQIEQVRFGDRLRVHWSIDPSAGGARVPPLLLQPLVENAVRHGVEPSESGADIWISSERRSGSVVLKVTNTVPAQASVPGHGMALDNVRDRLELLHDVQGHFRAGRRGDRFVVRMEVPA